jgi:multidrug resistance efflux pump
LSPPPREAKLREAESKIAASERKIRAYEKALMSEKWIVSKYNLERFFSKSDNAGQGL